MTRDELSRHLTCYEAGLKAELTLLAQIQRLSQDQRVAMNEQDLDRLTACADERARLMAGLVHLEHEIRTSRQILADYRAHASTLPGFAEIAALHRTAGKVVSAIVDADSETMAALREAERVRREASQVLETGKSSLAAYRRVLSPDVTTPALVDRHG